MEGLGLARGFWFLVVMEVASVRFEGEGG